MFSVNQCKVKYLLRKGNTFFLKNHYLQNEEKNTEQNLNVKESCRKFCRKGIFGKEFHAWSGLAKTSMKLIE